MIKFQRSYLSLGHDPSVRILPWIIGFIVYLTTLVVASVMIVSAISSEWQSQISGYLTVQIAANPNLTLEQEEIQRDKIVQILQSTVGISQIDVLSRQANAALLQPWIDPGTPLELLPLPQLISVYVEDQKTFDLEAMRQQLDHLDPTIFVDDHRQWASDLNKFVWTARLVALLALMLIGGILVLIVLYFTKVSLSVHGKVIETLHFVGATHDYIVGQFQNLVVGLASLGALLGLLAAIFSLYGFNWLIADSQIQQQPLFQLDFFMILAFVFIVIFSVGLVVMTTRRFVHRRLKELG